VVYLSVILSIVPLVCFIGLLVTVDQRDVMSG